MKLKITFLLILLTGMIISTSAQQLTPTIEGKTSVDATGNTYILVNWTVTDDNLKSYKIDSANLTVGEGKYEDDGSSSATKYLITIGLQLSEDTYTLVLTVTDFHGLTSEFTTTVNVSGGDLVSAPGAVPFDGNFMILALFSVGIILRKRNK